MGIFSFGKKGEASSERSSGRSRSSRGAERRAMDSDGPRSPAAARTRRSSAVGQEAMLDPTLPEKQRARRRLVGAIALVLAAVIVLPMVLDSHPKPATSDIAISIPNSDQSDDATSAQGSHAAATRSGAGAGVAATVAATAQATGADRNAAGDQDDDSDPTGAAAPDSPPPGAAGTVKGANATTNAAVAPTTPSTDIAKSRSAANGATGATGASVSTKTAKADASDAHAKAPAHAAVSPSATVQQDASADPLGEEIARRSAPTSANAASLPPTPATPGSRYVVQLGQFSGDSAARDWVGKLKNIGVPAYIEHQKQADGSTRVMLRAGPFADRSTAQTAVLKVRQAGLSSAGR